MAGAPPDHVFDILRGAFTGVFAVLWIGGAGAMGALGHERSPRTAVAVGVVGVTSCFVVLVEAMNPPRRSAASRLLLVVAFALLAGGGTALSPLSTGWRSASAVGAALAAAAAGGAALLSDPARGGA